MYRKLFISNQENWIKMKKILLLIIGIVLCYSCCPEKSKQQKEMERYEKVSNVYQHRSNLFELTYKDEHGEERTHQFVSIGDTEYMNGIAHWPDCKYCKERGL